MNLDVISRQVDPLGYLEGEGAPLPAVDCLSFRPLSHPTRWAQSVFSPKQTFGMFMCRCASDALSCFVGSRAHRFSYSLTIKHF